MFCCVQPAKVERAKAPAPAPKAAEVPVAKKTNKRGGVPLFVSQFGVLALYSGIVAAAFLVPESKWKVVNEVSQRCRTGVPAVCPTWIPSMRDVSYTISYTMSYTVGGMLYPMQ